MSDHKITIEHKAKDFQKNMQAQQNLRRKDAGSGPSAGSGRGSAMEKALRQAGSLTGRTRGGGEDKADVRKIRQQKDQTKSTVDNTKMIRELVKAISKGGGLSGIGNRINLAGREKYERAKAAGSSSGMMAGGAMRGVGATIPILGMAAGALGYLADKVFHVGEANLNKRMEQFSTAGVGGFSAGSQKYSMTGAQMGEYRKSMRMASSKYDTGDDLNGDTIRQEKSLSFASIGRALQHAHKSGEAIKTPMRDVVSREVGEDRSLKGLHLKYANKFGVGAGEIGTLMGYMDSMGGKGSMYGQFNKSIGALHSGGAGTDLPVVFSAMSQTLKKAVEEGVSSSTLAEDMAKEVGQMTRNNSGGNAISALKATQSMMGTQEQLSKGEFTGLANMQMFQAGRSMMKDPKMQKELIESGYFSESDFAKGKTLDANKERMGVQILSQKYKGNMREAYAKDIVGQLGGEGTEEEKMRRFHTLAQDYGLSTDTEQSKNLYGLGNKAYAAEKLPEAEKKLSEKKAQIEDIRSGRATKDDWSAGFGGGSFIKTFKRALTPEESAKMLQQAGEEAKALESQVSSYKKSIGPQVSVEDQINGAAAQMGRGDQGITNQAANLNIQREQNVLGQAGNAAAQALVSFETGVTQVVSELTGPIVAGIQLFDQAIVGSTKFIVDNIKTMKDMMNGNKRVFTGNPTTDWLMNRGRTE